MLSVKLPKGKVARALVACADVYAASAEAERTTFHKDLEVWRKDMNFVPGRNVKTSWWCIPSAPPTGNGQQG